MRGNFYESVRPRRQSALTATSVAMKESMNPDKYVVQFKRFGRPGGSFGRLGDVHRATCCALLRLGFASAPGRLSQSYQARSATTENVDLGRHQPKTFQAEKSICR